MDISPDKQNIDKVFSNTQYYIDFYQREYKWTQEPVKRLLDDIFINLMKSTNRIVACLLMNKLLTVNIRGIT